MVVVVVLTLGTTRKHNTTDLVQLQLDALIIDVVPLNSPPHPQVE